nr:HDIG domain-containing metalloprotein [Maliibacterium massiliense]
MKRQPRGKKDAPVAREATPKAQVGAVDIKEKPTRRQLMAAVLMGLVTFVLCVVLIIMAVSPKRYDLRVDDVAPATIKATKDVEDKLSTQALYDKAAQSVDIKYTQDDTVTQSVMEDVDSFTATLKTIVTQGETERTRWVEEQRQQFPDRTPNEAKFQYSGTFLASIQNQLPFKITDQETRALLGLSASQMNELCVLLRSSIQTAMNGGIKETGLEETVQGVADGLTSNLGAYAQEVQDVAAQSVQHFVRPNMLYDADALKAAQEKAKESVTPVTYKKGEIVVEEGKRITQAQWAVLDSLGLLKSKTLDLSLYVGVCAMVAMVLGMLGWYIYLFCPAYLRDTPKVLLLCIIITMMMAVGYFCQMIDARVVPVAAGGLMVAVLFRDRLALVFNTAIAVLVGLMAGESGEMLSITMLYLILVNVFAGSVGIFVLRRKQVQRTTLLWAGLVVSVAAAIGYGTTGILTTNSISEILTAGGIGLLSGFLAGVLSLGTLPLWEMLFNLVTPMKLLELSNPHQPLLKKLLMEAPGTYHHSIIVANLAEQAADAIGANGLLARVGAYYHDVGKLKRPYFFKENQPGNDNPHDRIAPELSAMIITSHPADGLVYAQKYKLPTPLQDIILQHHGTTAVMYFYVKACERAKRDGTAVNMMDFRYPGPRPQTREAAVIMLADTVEAAVRAMEDPTPERIVEKVDKLVRGKLDDGQLNECHLTLMEVTTVIHTLARALKGVYHERIEYPTLDGQTDAKSVSKSLEVEEKA